MKTTILFLLSLFALNIVQAQEQEFVTRDTLSTNKLIEMFRVNFGLNDSENLQIYDQSMSLETGGVSIFSYSPLDSIVEGFSGEFRAKWLVKYKDGKSLLCLKKIVPVRSSKEKAEELFSRLKDEYGIDWEYGIPAKWFTGEIRFIHCPKRLFDEVVSKNGVVLEVKDGYITSRKRIKIKNGTLENSFHLQEDGRILVRMDGCWWDDIQINTDSLNNFVNKNLPTGFKNTIRREYPVLLIIDSSTGAIRFHYLSPQMMEARDKDNIAYLKKRLEELPPWSFGPLLTLGGQLIYARYLKATLLEEEWELKDYLLEQEKIVSFDTMIANFHNHSKQPVSNDLLKRYDPFLGYENGDGILTKSPLDKLPGCVAMPSSRAEWEIDYSDITRPFLCLKRILPLGITKDIADKRKEILASYFGRKSGRVHAIWFTGDLIFYSCPQNLFGEFVSGGKMILKVNKGEILGRQYEYMNKGNINNYVSSEPQKVEGTNISISTAGYNDGCWIYGSSNRAQALGSFVNDNLSVVKGSELTKEFLFLMYTDFAGISTIHLLQPEKPDAVEQKLVADLKQQIAKLPQWSFGWLKTINGAIFPGCYLKAKYSGEHGWIFEDWAYENKKL